MGLVLEHSALVSKSLLTIHIHMFKMVTSGHLYFFILQSEPREEVNRELYLPNILELLIACKELLYEQHWNLNMEGSRRH